MTCFPVKLRRSRDLQPFQLMADGRIDSAPGRFVGFGSTPDARVAADALANLVQASLARFARKLRIGKTGTFTAWRISAAA